MTFTLLILPLVSETPEDSKIIYLPSTSRLFYLDPRPSFLPSAVPLDLFPELGRIADLPIAWWMGQLYKFAFQYSDLAQSLIERKIAELRMGDGPIVGMHVRRTDKLLGEAELRYLKDYMRTADEFFDVQELSGPIYKRRIYIATDEPHVVDRATRKFPAFEILSNLEATSLNHDPATRNSFDALLGMLVDVEVLARCDFVICTYTSNVCRLLHEIRMGRDPENFQRLVTMDDQYWTFGENQQVGEIVAQTVATHKLNVRIGDRVEIDYKVNGKGHHQVTNLDSGQTAKLLKFAVERRPESVPFQIE